MCFVQRNTIRISFLQISLSKLNQKLKGLGKLNLKTSRNFIYIEDSFFLFAFASLLEKSVWKLDFETSEKIKKLRSSFFFSSKSHQRRIDFKEKYMRIHFNELEKK